MTVFTIISGICSIIGVVIALCKMKTSAIIALALCSVFLLFILTELTMAIIKLLKQENGDEGFKVHFNYMYYVEHCDTKHTFDSYEGIQCKRPFLNSVMHKYDWSGTNPPKIDSSLQNLGRDLPGNKKALNPEDRFDRKELILKTPLLYNQVTMVHFQSTMDDGDKMSNPCVSYRIDGNISFILFRVTLLNRDENFKEEAHVYKVPFSEVLDEHKHYLATCTFDTVTKSYDFSLPNPTPGYTYYLIWKKNK